MEVTCQVCGKPVTLQDVPDTIPAGPIRSAIMKLARMCVHSDGEGDTCYRRKWFGLVKEREDQLVQERMATVAGICPPEFQETDPQHPKMNTPPASAAMAWEFGRSGLLLVGPTGQCKSRCAYQVMKREHLAGRQCVQYSAGEWAWACLGLKHNFAAAQRWMMLVRDCDILMIDDLGKARMTYQDHEATQATELLFDVLDHRFKHHKPVIVTTQLHADDFKQKWGEHGKAFARRLSDFCVVVKFG